MAKEIILYNLRGGVNDDDYKKWCGQYKGPTLISLDSVKSFLLINALNGIAGNGQEKRLPAPAALPFKYIGIIDSTSPEAWDKDRKSKIFKEEFFPQWFSMWVADFYILEGVEVYEGKNISSSGFFPI